MSTAIFEKIDWKDFFENYWDKKPVLFKKPFGDDNAFDEKEIFKILQKQGDIIRSGKNTDVTIFNQERLGFNGGRKTSHFNCGLEDLLPTNEHRAFDDYVEELMRKDKFQDFGIYINRSHLFPYIWDRMRSMLLELYKHIGISNAPVNTDIFMGNYKKTAFGAHKDPLHNFMFMVRGSRAMRLWDDPVWKKALGKNVHHRYTTTEYEQYNDVSEHYVLEEGDMLYWPARYWHVGEGDGSFSISANLDYMLLEEQRSFHYSADAALYKMADFYQLKIAEAEDTEAIPIDPENIQAGLNDLPSNIQNSVEGFRHLIASERFDFYVEQSWLEMLSSLGFVHVPPKLPKRHFHEGDHIESDPKFPVIYKKFKNFLFVAANGHCLTLKHNEAVVDLIKKINRGKRMNVGMLADEFCHRKNPLIDKRIFLGILEELYSFRVFV